MSTIPRLQWWGFMLLIIVIFFTFPVLVLLLLPFARNVEGQPVWPLWLAWINTPDDPNPNQGMYESQVAWWYNWLGWRAKTWYWAGVRNQGYGLVWALCPKTESGDVFWQSAVYPNQNSPYTPGSCTCTMKHRGRIYYEYVVVGDDDPGYCYKFWYGWKLQAVHGTKGQPIAPVIQIKPRLTKP